MTRILIICNILIKVILDTYLLKDCDTQFTVHVKVSLNSFSIFFF